jgi:nitrite reductase/ring-hydroxylating ferredoxin subunit
MARREIAAVDELAKHGSYVIEEVEGREIAVFNVHGEYHALLNYCVHQSGPLCEDSDLRPRTTIADDGWEWTYEEEETVVTCPWHYWKFDVTTGESVDVADYAVPTYETAVDDGTVYVDV